MEKILRIRMVTFIVLMHTFSLSQSTTLFLQKQSVFTRDGYKPFFVVNPEHSFGEKFGLSSLVVMTPSWAEVLAGPTYTPKTGLTLKTLFGYEQVTQGIPLRALVGVTYFGERWSSVSLIEYGNTGYWYLHTTLYELKSIIKTGIHAQRFAGIGPRVDIPFKNFTLWNAPLYNPETKDYGYIIGASLFLQTQK
ncbi:MAG: hypothetical protein LRY41_01160 [Candidatus Pacebacteria bacterium]|nr:hypothetical protein [Candidatus Paceibacterota bacterium]MCD8508405.1 hypothetical protein [Candidatus Paceibacterota bacterium]MCD8527926.1 hypothetical protein [Candidatus Paceibacterota bacterium]MCD8563720.1 hypothetical protein [Candidatus Paceibacterota bacterium]